MREGWQIRKLGDVCSVRRDSSIHTGINYVGLEHISSGNGVLVSLADTSGVIGTTNLFNAGDVLYGKLRPYLKKVIVADCDGCCSTEILPIRCNGDILPDFLKYWFLEDGITDKINATCGGCRMPRANMKDVFQFAFAFPSLPEQQRIVDILDREFAKIDALKVNAEKSLQAAKDLFQATLKKELGGKTKNLATLLSICQSIVDCPHSTPIKSPEKTNFPCIRTSELKAGRISWATMQYVSEDEYRKRITRLQPQEGDIVYGREGTIGDAVMLPSGYHFCLGQRTMLFRPNRSLINPKYLLYCVISPFVYNQAMSRNTGCGVAHVNVADVKQFLIPVPEQIDEQRRIVSYLDALNDKCSKLQENYQKTLTLCDDLKQSLLRKAFSGEL